MASSTSPAAFPLLSLPKHAILKTTRVMDIGGILGLSLTSKRCKNYVCFAGIVAEHNEVRIATGVTIIIWISTTKNIRLFFPIFFFIQKNDREVYGNAHFLNSKNGSSTCGQFSIIRELNASGSIEVHLGSTLKKSNKFSEKPMISLSNILGVMHIIS
ncbi:hypothetical protein CAEBREN_17392 [Caenorhabditis brenneri]|uniref:Uncharacterized protein n=1 Tax=Caenorhabditis brenneri TaxID=135651 RepID=G0MBA1_CAEBE|nr:hypothetical protein CAEBREN_17392 [Caenorhabditis brenneri]